MTSWSDLDYDVLEHIVAFLPLADHHRFSAVCRNWRWVAKHKHCSPCAQLPWLVMRQEASGVRRKFFNLTENREYYIDIPHLYEQYCCGSSYGWLFIVDRKFKARLLNPFTSELYELPEFPKMDAEMNRGRIVKAILSDDPSVKSDFTVVFLYAWDKQAMFWRNGDSAWTYIRCKKGTIKEAVFFQGRLYVVYSMGSIYTIKLGRNPTARLAGPKGPPSSPLMGVCYLVDFMDELLLVHRSLKNLGDSSDRHVVTKHFDVHKVDLESRRLSPCMDLGDYAIFLGVSSPVVVDSKQFQGCKRNSIYFTDVHVFCKLSSREYGCHDLGVYDMKKDVVEPYYPPEIFQPIHEPPIWLTPNCNTCTFN